MTIAIAVGTILVIAWLSAAAAAVRSVSRIWLRHWVEQRLRGEGDAALRLDRPHRMLAASGAAIALSVGILGAMLGAEHAGSPSRLALLVVAWGAVMLVIGQTVPRAIGRHWAPYLAPILRPPVRVVERGIGPLLTGARSLLGARAKMSAEGTATREGIEDLLREGALEGIGARDEIAIITGVMDFEARTVREVMTPRADIFALEATTDPSDLAMRIAASGYSRVPLYSGSLDQVDGMVHVFDVLKAGGDRMPPVRPVAMTLDSRRCSELLVEMQRRRLYLAIVRDADGRTVGLVTLEDLLEELVGDISDEHDEPAANDVPSQAPITGARL